MAGFHALFSSPTLPAYDRESGQQRTFTLIRFLRELGWAVTFLPQNGTGEARYVRALQQLGVATYCDAKYFKNPEALIQAGQFDLAVLTFWYQAELLLPLLRTLSPKTKIIVDTVDLHFLRLARESFHSKTQLGTSKRLDDNYAQLMTRELNVYAAADAVLTVSQKEADLVNDFLAAEKAYVVPDCEALNLSPVPRDKRKGLLFVGNFQHPPNISAVQFLCNGVVPRLEPAILAEHPITIVGNNLTETVSDLGKDLPNVHMVGWVPSLLPYLNHACLSLCPLLYGAGTKRKAIQSLMVGTPLVTTNIGAEGLNLQHGEHALIADQPQQFADAIQSLVTNAELWECLASRGRVHVLENYSYELAKTKYATVIENLLNQKSPDMVEQGHHKVKPSDSHAQPNEMPQKATWNDGYIFYEEVNPNRPTHLDQAKDRVAKDYAALHGTYSGFCNISDRWRNFKITSDNYRENIHAEISGSYSRQRQIVCGLSIALFGHPNATLSNICDYINKKDLKLYTVEANGALFNGMQSGIRPDLLFYSEYFGPQYASGALVNGTPHQDLQHLSFPDATFDIILTSEVMEHIPDAQAAECEIARVLKPDGVYCFTVPLSVSEEHDIVLAALDDGGNIHYYSEPVYHGDPVNPENGILAYRIFALGDLEQRFKALNFTTSTYRFWSQVLGMLGEGNIVHVFKKQPAG